MLAKMGKIVLGILLLLAVAGGFGFLVQQDSGIPSMWSDTKVSSVVVDSEEVEEIKGKYTSDEERAWCLFGEIRENEEEGTATVVVKEVVWDSDAESDTESVEFNCRQGISAPEDADYLGHVHSHPSGVPAQPSSQDEATGHGGAVVMGIYNGDELNFFVGENIAAALEGGADVNQVEFELRDLGEDGSEGG